MAKDTFYFSHDYNARSDDKIKRLIRKHGMTGYGVYWAIIEDLYNNSNELELDFDGIAFDLRCSAELIESVITEFDLFVIDAKCYGSASVERRLNDRNAKSRKAAESANQRWAKKREADANASKVDANALQPECDSNAIKESKGKERKEKEKNYRKTLLSEIAISDFPELNKDYIEIAKAFQGLFKGNLQEAGASTKNADNMKGTSIDDIRLIIESDHYTIETLREIYHFLQVDRFWKKNILSTSKLREKMDKLKLQIKHGNSGANHKEATTWNQLAEIVAESYNG